MSSARRLASATVALAFSLSSAPELARAAATPAPAADTAEIPIPIPPARTVVTHHTATIGGKLVKYTATAGTILLDDEKRKPTASVFYVAYTVDGATSARRPITFSYNGGPGGSSALVDVGAFGPRMVVTANGAQTPPPPYDIVDNRDSILDATDLVFIDAVGTGFSRLVGTGKPKDYYGVEQDGHAFSQFIRRYITTNDRWNSPKYLAGESYGTTRSAVLSKMLGDDGIALNGITLMSTVLDFANLEGGSGDDRPYWLYLPSEAAVAAYQKKTAAPANLDAFLAQVRTFAEGPFLAALAQGDRLPAAEKARIAAQLHDYTGLPTDYILRSDLRVDPSRFEKELLGPERETVGRYDARFRAFDLDPIASEAEVDPSSDAIFAAFTAAFNRYVRQELNYKTDDKYEFLSYDVNRAWEWNPGGHATPVAVDVDDDLARAMTSNRYLRVFSANGLYDLATPFFNTEYSLGHLGIAKPLQSNISYGYYPAGHMIYLNPVAHAALKRDLDAFYARGARS